MIKNRFLWSVPLLICALLTMSACGNSQSTDSQNSSQTTTNKEHSQEENQATHQKSTENNPVIQYKMAVKYAQNSAAVHALQVQAYNIAKEKLSEYLKTHSDNKNPAVVLDLDETVLDNTPLMAMGIKKGFDYTKWGKHWRAWVQDASADLIPGAKSFLKYADQKGVKIFYISNRVAGQEKATIKNMKKLGLPQVTKNSVMLQGKSKKIRRNVVKENHDIALLIGDSLHDFSAAFIKESSKKRNHVVENMENKFGDKFIILPNPSYGEWTDSKLKSWK